MLFSNTPRPEALKSLADVKLIPFWLDDPNKPEPVSPLTEKITADLVIVGAGFTGLWTALQAKQAVPDLDVVLLEAGESAIGASGRNGGFVASSLTHSFQNGMNRWPKEMPKLVELGHKNLDGIEAAIKKYNIDCDFLCSGEIIVATEEYQVDELRDEVIESAKVGEHIQFLDSNELRKRVNSPTYLAGILDPSVAMVNPARLAWGLRRACLQLGVRLFEGTQVKGLEERRDSKRVILKTQYSQVESKKVALATNAFPPLLKQLSFYMVPVYDYVLMTEPLSKSQRDEVGWHGREGVGDGGNQFHYYRTTADGRILWGGYDAIYYRNNGIAPHFENRPASFGLLAEHFFQTFPQLTGLRFTHAWGGVIDTCSRYTAFWGKAMRGKVAYAMGYTGLGVGASRFGAQVMLDLLDNKKTERTELQMVKSKPFPFPPEPFRSPIINFTRWSLDQADRNAGKRNLWLKTLDTLGLGFDS
ncbi:MAG: FAD-dependent oxidoreductase [Anaerolineales bacterium]|nr:FAD-dependent oxidoreductase [Anaerolineales bacterium]